MLLQTQCVRQSIDEKPQQQRADQQIHAGAGHIQGQVVLEIVVHRHWQRYVPGEQNHVSHACQCRYCQQCTRRQRRRGQGDGYQQQGDKRIAGAAGEIQQVPKHQHIDGDMNEGFPFAHRPWLAEPPRSEHRKHSQQANADQQWQQRNLQLHPPRAEKHGDALAGDGTDSQPRQGACECKRTDALGWTSRHG